ncbi:MAG: hypothetical protein WDM76_14550 [Limisphaerales bacterium]
MTLGAVFAAFFSAGDQIGANGSGTFPSDHLHRRFDRQAHHAPRDSSTQPMALIVLLSVACISASALEITAARSASIAGTGVENLTIATSATNSKQPTTKMIPMCQTDVHHSSVASRG